MNEWLRELSASAARVAASGKRVLVEIEVEGRPDASGVVWAPDAIVTNAHVARFPRMDVRLPSGRTVRADRIAWDPGLDLAVLRFEGQGETAGRIGSSAALRPGEWVYAIGDPWGVRGALTGGVFIGEMPMRRRRSGERPGLLAMSLHLRPGHSGGPVVNAAGEIVGVNTMMNGPNVGLAIASDTVGRFLDDHRIGRAAAAGRRAA